MCVSELVKIRQSTPNKDNELKNENSNVNVTASNKWHQINGFNNTFVIHIYTSHYHLFGDQ